VAHMQFAIADFDGDRKPDMASVEVEKQQAGSTNYAIRLQFAAGTDSYIGVKGPLGGLRVAVRDVNGDDSLDLVLTSVVNPRVIQVLLNDGHGNFAASGAESFVSVESDARLALCEQAAVPSDRLVLASARSSFELEILYHRENLAFDTGVSMVTGNRVLPASWGQQPTRGRAPPAVDFPA
jgi:hypothetical protein